jgi:hypothetical protein
VRLGTIFESSHVPLHKWLQAMYLCGCGTKPIKPQRLGAILNVSFKTAVFIISRLQHAAQQSGVIGSGVRYESLSRGGDHADDPASA